MRLTRLCSKFKVYIIKKYRCSYDNNCLVNIQTIATGWYPTRCSSCHKPINFFHNNRSIAKKIYMEIWKFDGDPLAIRPSKMCSFSDFIKCKSMANDILSTKEMYRQNKINIHGSRGYIEGKVISLWMKQKILYNHYEQYQVTCEFAL